MAASGGPASSGGGNAGIGTGNAASVGIGGDAGPSTSGDISSTTATGAKTFNFNAPASRFTESWFGKGTVAAALLIMLLALAAWLKKQKK